MPAVVVAEATGKTMVAEPALSGWQVRHPFKFEGRDYATGESFTHGDPRVVRKLRAAGNLWDPVEVPGARY